MEKMLSDMILKMIEKSKANIHDINHFLKVYAFSRTIAEGEALDSKAKEALYISAVIHDIACPLCREKHGNAAGYLQELESPALVTDFVEEYSLTHELAERVIWLVSHHHTYKNVAKLEHQILLEADYLVNAEESGYSKEQIADARQSIFRTETGIKLLDTLFLTGVDKP